MKWLGGNRYSSQQAIFFSKILKIRRVSGPHRHFLWRHRGWRISVDVFDVKNMVSSTYIQNYESWFHAIVRVTYYRLYSYYHNFRYRRFHKRA